MPGLLIHLKVLPIAFCNKDEQFTSFSSHWFHDSNINEFRIFVICCLIMGIRYSASMQLFCSRLHSESFSASAFSFALLSCASFAFSSLVLGIGISNRKKKAAINTRSGNNNRDSGSITAIANTLLRNFSSFFITLLIYQ